MNEIKIEGDVVYIDGEPTELSLFEALLQLDPRAIAITDPEGRGAGVVFPPASEEAP